MDLGFAVFMKYPPGESIIKPGLRTPGLGDLKVSFRLLVARGSELGSGVLPAEVGETSWQMSEPPSLGHDAELGFEVSQPRGSGGARMEWNFSRNQALSGQVNLPFFGGPQC